MLTMQIGVYRMLVIYMILQMSIRENIRIHLHKLNHSINPGEAIKMNFAGEHFGFIAQLVKTII